MTGITPTGPMRIGAMRELKVSPSRQLTLHPNIISLSHKIPIHISTAEYLNSRDSYSGMVEAINSRLTPDQPFENQQETIRKCSNNRFDLASVNLSGVPTPLLIKKGTAFRMGSIFRVVHMGQVKEGFLEPDTQTPVPQPRFEPVSVPVKKMAVEGSGPVPSGSGKMRRLRAAIGSFGKMIAIGQALVVPNKNTIEDFPNEDIRAQAEQDPRVLEAEDAELRETVINDVMSEIVEEMVIQFTSAYEEVNAKFLHAQQPDSPGQQAIALNAILMTSLFNKCVALMRDKKICAAEAARDILGKHKETMSGHDGFIAKYNELEDLLIDILVRKHVISGKTDMHVVDVESVVETCGLKDFVLVCNRLSPAEHRIFENPDLLGVVREKGSYGDHINLTARGRRIISLVLPHNLAKELKTGTPVALDVTRPEQIIIEPDTETIEQETTKKARLEKLFDDIAGSRGTEVLNPCTGKKVSLMVNASVTPEIASAVNNGADGIGLDRTEYFFMKTAEDDVRMERPSLAEQVKHYNRHATTCGPDNRHVLRTVDVGIDEGNRDKWLAYMQMVNPAQHAPEESTGLALCLNDVHFRTLFFSQLEAVILSDVREVMFPQVRSKKEIEEAMALVGTITDDLEDENEPGNLKEEKGKRYKELGLKVSKVNKEVKWGAMIEEDGMFAELDAIARDPRMSFFSVGTNDLTTSVTHTPRFEGDALLFREAQFRPDVLRRIKEAYDTVTAAGKPISICGNMASDWRSLLLFLAMGYNDFSFDNVTTADMARRIIFEISRNEEEGKASLKELLDGVMVLDEPRAIIRFIEDYMNMMIISKKWNLDDVRDLLDIY